MGCYVIDLLGVIGFDLRKVGGKYDVVDIEEIIKKGCGLMLLGFI